MTFSKDKLFSLLKLDPLFTPVRPEAGSLFRIIFFFSILLHYLPIVLEHSANFAPGSYRVSMGSSRLFQLLPTLGNFAIYFMHSLFLTTSALAICGIAVRMSSWLLIFSLHFYVSVNSLNVNTLAIWPVFSILFVTAIFPGFDGCFVVPLPFKKKPQPPYLLAYLLILIQILGSFFFAGIEKLIAGWVTSNPMHILLNYPRGTMPRSWVYALPFLQSPPVGWLFTGLTLLLELFAPVLFIFKKTRIYAFILYQLFFLGIFFMLMVPPLFYLLYASATLLAMHNDERMIIFFDSLKEPLFEKFARRFRNLFK